MHVLLSIVGVIVVCVGMLVGSYNGLVSADENVTSRWSQVENQMQRRSDLIPNLVSTVKGYAKHESDVFKSVSDARSRLAGATTPADKIAANGELSGALSRLLAISENYPQLKADTNFKQLQDELAGTENRLAVARRDYNNAAQKFNTKVKSFPTSLYAGMFGFAPREYFKVEEGAKAVPKVAF